MWRKLPSSQFGMMNTIDDVIYRGIEACPHQLPDISQGETLIAVSDYSGQHKGAQFESYAFLITSLDNWQIWEQQRLNIRAKTGIGKRRISYKSLNDRRKIKVLPHFLDAADTLPCLCVVIAIDRKIESLFNDEGRINMNDSAFKPYESYTAHDFEQLLRVVHFTSYFLAALSHPGQNVLWFTDQDNIAANEKKVRLLTTAWATVFSNYVQHNLGHLRCGTSNCDNGSLQIEDLMSIADLSAGAVSEMATLHSLENTMPASSQIIQPPPQKISSKARYVLGWLSRKRVALKRCILLLESTPNSTSIRVKELHLHGD
jgi:hypothetical protein